MPIELASFKQGITTETSMALCGSDATRSSFLIFNSLAFTPATPVTLHFQLAFSRTAIIMAKFASEVPRVPETPNCPIYRTYLPRPALRPWPNLARPFRAAAASTIFRDARSGNTRDLLWGGAIGYPLAELRPQWLS